MSRPGGWKSCSTVIKNSLDQFLTTLRSFCFYDKILVLQLAHNATVIDEKWATPTFLRVWQLVRHKLLSRHIA